MAKAAGRRSQAQAPPEKFVTPSPGKPSIGPKKLRVFAGQEQQQLFKNKTLLWGGGERPKGKVEGIIENRAKRGERKRETSREKGSHPGWTRHRTNVSVGK